MTFIQQVSFDFWTRVLTFGAFLMLLTVAVTITVYCLGMPRKKLKHLENLPLEDDKHE